MPKHDELPGQETIAGKHRIEVTAPNGKRSAVVYHGDTAGAHDTAWLAMKLWLEDQETVGNG
jgi:hypothetical protein